MRVRRRLQCPDWQLQVSIYTYASLGNGQRAMTGRNRNQNLSGHNERKAMISEFGQLRAHQIVTLTFYNSSRLTIYRPTSLNEFYIYGSTAAKICLTIQCPSPSGAARGKLMNFLCKCKKREIKFNVGAGKKMRRRRASDKGAEGKKCLKRSRRAGKLLLKEKLNALDWGSSTLGPFLMSL